MNNLLEELKKYYNSTPQDIINSDWAKSEEFDSIKPTIEEFLTHNRHYFENNELINNSQLYFKDNIKPEFSSVLFLN